MSSATAGLDDGLSTFLSVRARLFGIAYRMLRSAAEAEDVVQDVWVRWQTTDRARVRDAAAFLSTATTRLAINVIRSARSRHETYPGCWPSEPIDGGADPRERAERGQALAHGVQLLVDQLTPTERSAFILREAFDYPYREIARVLRIEEANARQVVTRARRHVADRRVATAFRLQPWAGSSWRSRRSNPPMRSEDGRQRTRGRDPFAVACRRRPRGAGRHAAPPDRQGSRLRSPLAWPMALWPVSVIPTAPPGRGIPALHDSLPK